MDVMSIAGADRVLDEVRALLLADEARHNLALGILSTARGHPELYPVVQAWVVRDEGRIVGAALRTPPHNLVLVQPAADGAVEALATAIDDELPGVVGAVPEVDVFATSWSVRHGRRAEPRFEQGVYALTSVVDPLEPSGAMRLAVHADRGLLLEWVRAFAAEVLPEGPDRDPERHERSIDARLAGDDAGFALWEVDGRPVSLAGFGGPTPNGIRIGPVYTPPEQRGRGYGTAVTAAASRLLLERGYRFCFLYTDLANATSNAIYTRIGYQRVCDSREIAFL